MPSKETSRRGPLSGIRVIDLTRILAGPFCTMNLGDMGAEIIKIEQPGKGDDTRSWGPPFAGDQAAYFLGINRNKKSVTLNLKDKRGQKILGDLLKNADILIENFKTGTIKAWGFSEEWFKSKTPQLIRCSITGYGDKGPKAGMPGYDFLLQAESGLMSVTGEENGGPQKLGVAIVDVCTGQYAAMCILAALNARRNNGKGQRVDLSLFNTSLSMLINVASNYLIGEENPARYGNGHPNIVPYRDFPCNTGEIAIAVGNDIQFEKLAIALDHPEWVADKRFLKNSDRVKHREECDGVIRAALSSQNADYWIDLLQRDGIPCSKINSVDDALESEQANENNMVLKIDHLTSGTIRTLGIPYSFSETPVGVDLPPPILGGHTKEILKSLVNLYDKQIDELSIEGVI